MARLNIVWCHSEKAPNTLQNASFVICVPGFEIIENVPTLSVG